jgi:N-acetylmuramoyl-L-alanine amidase
MNDNSEQKSDTLASIPSQSGEISFKVQVTSSPSKTEIKPENFKGLTDITEFTSQDRFKYKYAAGSFTDFSAAANYRKKIEVFYPDAFVIAVKNDKILPLQQALEQKRKSQKE